jgi:hypothetical protein
MELLSLSFPPTVENVPGSGLVPVATVLLTFAMELWLDRPSNLLVCTVVIDQRCARRTGMNRLDHAKVDVM